MNKPPTRRDRRKVGFSSDDPDRTLVCGPPARHGPEGPHPQKLCNRASRRSFFTIMAPCPSKQGTSARLHRDATPGQTMEPRASRGRAHRHPARLDIRFVVINLEYGSPEWVYESLYCARGQAENLIQLQRRNSRPTAPAAGRPPPTRCASCSTPPPIGSCSRRATPFRRCATWPWPSSRPCACGFSRWRSASSKRSVASASPCDRMPRGRPHPQHGIGPEPRRTLTCGAEPRPPVLSRPTRSIAAGQTSGETRAQAFAPLQLGTCDQARRAAS